MTDTLMRKEAVPDVINLLLGAWLFLTPWIFGFVADSAASWTAWIAGVVIAGLAVAALVSFADWEEWTNIFVGLVTAVAPWIAGFAANSSALRVHLITGVVVAALAGIRLWLVHRSPPRVTA